MMSAVFGLISTFLMIVSIGTSGRGEVAAVFAASFLAPVILSLGVASSVRFYAALNQLEAAIYFARIFCLSLVPIAILVGYVLSVGPLSSSSAGVRWLTILTLSTAPLTLLYLCYEAGLTSQGRFASVAALSTIQPAINLVGLLVLNITSLSSVESVLVLNIFGVTVTLAISHKVAAMRGRRHGLSFRSFILYGFRSWGAESSDVASNKLDQILLLPILGVTSLGVYSVVSAVSSIPLTLGYALNAKTYNLIADAKEKNLHPVLKQALISGLVWGFIAALIVFVSAPLIPIIFGPSLNQGVIPCLIAGVGTFAAVGQKISTSGLMAVDKAGLATACRVSGLAIAIALIPFLAGNLGIEGAAIASASGYMATFLFSLFFLHINKVSRAYVAQPLRNALRVLFKS
jgi:O-antigen/teichoic acid export membrane protein